MIHRFALPLTLCALLLGTAAPAGAEEPLTIPLSIKNHRFNPDRVEVPAGKPFVLIVKNEDATPEEFESKMLHREKVIQGGKEAKIKFDALKPGEYPFVGEFHEDQTKGVIVAK
ncbi:MAG: cupredoxin domain-containing protein [Magnetococcales bacterium]|nr:cupredoxin domain-containing protein [Magnetococcales bacterium]MBF0156085.1 cupredoxin domain-containing protein [Magnetococcales bacterium]